MKLPPNHSEIKVRVGQRWKKKDIGQIVEITGFRKDMYATRKMNGSYKTHGITKKTLLLYWELI